MRECPVIPGWILALRPSYVTLGLVPAVRLRRGKAMCRSKAEGGRRCRGKSGRGSLAALGSTGSSAAPDPPGPMQRSREAVLREAQKQLGDLLDAVINAAPDAPAAMVVSAIDADVASQVADAITTALEAHGVRRGKRGATYCAVPSPLWRMR